MKNVIWFLSFFLIGIVGTFYPIIMGYSKSLPGDKTNFDFINHKKELSKFLKLNSPLIASFTLYNVSSSGGVNFKDRKFNPFEILFVEGEKRIKIDFSNPRYTRTISRGSGVSSDLSFYYFEMTKETLEEPMSKVNTMSWPKCNLKCVWDRAIEQGADPSHKAEITYDRDEIIFKIRSTDKNFEITLPNH